MFRGKNYKDSKKLIDSAKLYDPAEGLDLVIKGAKAKFDETVEAHIDGRSHGVRGRRPR